MALSGNSRVRKARQHLGLAQAALGVLAKVSPGLVCHVELYGYRPSPAVRDRLARALGTTAADLWPGD